MSGTVRVNRYAGSKHYQVHVEGHGNVGMVEKRPDGFVPSGCRKPRKSMELAVRDLVWRAMQKALADAAILSKASVDWPVVEGPSK